MELYSNYNGCLSDCAIRLDALLQDNLIALFYLFYQNQLNGANNVFRCFKQHMNSNLTQLIRQYKEDNQSFYNTWFINNEERLKAFRSIRRDGVL